MGPHPLNRRAWLQAGAALATGWGLGGCTPEAPSASVAHIAGGFIGANIDRGHAMRDRLRQGLPLPAPAATRRAQVVIAGGGIAALAAARALRLAGVHDVAVLELEDSVGGNSRAGQVAGLPCPLGAHYLPVPGDDAAEVQDLLEELGVRERVAGRWQYRDEYLCFSPQERLFRDGEWLEGLLQSQHAAPATLAQYRRFAALVTQAMATQRFSMPALRSWLPGQGVAPAHQALDAISFDTWLRQQQLGDPQLRWYLDYGCLDDFGAGAARVSAWAGLHYFASRHGFQAPGEDGEPHDSVLTWPEGNGWLARRLAAPAQQAGWLHTGRTVLAIAEERHGVQVDALDVATGTIERWQAAHCIVALPVFIARQVVQNPPPFVAAAAQVLDWAPWLVANVHIRAPLADRPGAEPAWDNVFYDDVANGGLGYVNAGHQRLNAQQQLPTVLTCYRALAGAQGDPGAARAALARLAWPEARDAALAPLARAHPDIFEKATRIDVMRYGHAMAIPRPGAQTVLSQIGLQRPSSKRQQLLNGEQTTLLPTPGSARLHFAHGDWSGYSVFEEAFTRGHHAALRALSA
ncbi:MAG: FAD-dependent oxidoreductase [Comamonas sp.]